MADVKLAWFVPADVLACAKAVTRAPAGSATAGCSDVYGLLDV